MQETCKSKTCILANDLLYFGLRLFQRPKKAELISSLFPHTLWSFPDTKVNIIFVFILAAPLGMFSVPVPQQFFSDLQFLHVNTIIHMQM